MKAFIALTLMFVSCVSFAASDNQLIQACATAGHEKLKAEASAHDCILDSRSVRVTGIDNRFYNPSKYVWFSARAICLRGQPITVQTLTQYSFGRCF